MKPDKSLITYNQVLRLHRQGTSTKTIANIVGRSKSTIYKWINGSCKPWGAWDKKELDALNKEKTKKIAGWNKGKKGYWLGKKFSKEHKRRLAESKYGKKNPNWVGNKAKKGTGRNRARVKYGVRKGYEIHHVDGNPLNNHPSNIIFLKRREHMLLDGRLDDLIQRNRLGGTPNK